MDEKKIETLVIEQQKRLTMTGVLSVDSFSCDSIIASINSGRLQIYGQGLKILAFSKQSGSLSVDGQINTVKYGGKKIPFLKRLSR